MGLYIFLMIATAVVIFLAKVADGRAREAKEEEERHQEAMRAEQERKNQEWLANAIRLLQLEELRHQAKLVGDEDTINQVVNDVYDGKLPEEVDGYYTSVYDNLMIQPIAGINYRGSMKSYVGDFNGVIVPEPKNDYDPNAIKIKCEDGKHLGYIRESETANVREFIGNKDFERYRVTGHIDEREDDYDNKKFYVGRIYIVKS